MVDVCVVGAGIIGAATAYHLALLGARVTVLDTTSVPGGASAATFGWLNANGKQPDHYFELNRDGMAAHGELARALGDDSWFHGGGSLEWTDAARSDALRARVDEYAARGYPAQIVDRTRQLELESAVSPGNATTAAFFENEGWADTVALVGLLLSAAGANGARVLLGARVTDLAPASGGRVDVTTDAAETHPADVVVNCAGPDSGSIAALAGIHLETEGPAGMNVVTAAPAPINRVIRAPNAHFRPETGGRMMIAAPAADAELAGGADPNEVAPRVVAAAAEYVPGLRDARIEEVRIARRAIPRDGLPVVGRTPEAPWLYHLVTHSGVTLAPLLGRLAAEEIVSDVEHARLAPYRPARFAVSVSS